jgi:TolB protein
MQVQYQNKRDSLSVARLALLLLILLATLLFNSCRNNPVTSPPVSDEPNILRIDFEPAWSPDGQTIAFCRTEDTLLSKTGLWFINADGTNARQVFNGFFNSPAWSPDGQWLAFVNNKQIWKVKSNGDSLRRLTTGQGNFEPSWSPDNRYIAFGGNEGAGIMNTDGAEKKIFPQMGGYPNWHPIERKIISAKSYSPSIWLQFPILRIDTIAVIERVLDAVKDAINNYPKYSPDGTKILFTSQTDGSFPQIWVMNADGSNRRQLTTTQGYSACWSPDGTRICYCDSRRANGRLWIMNSDGSNKRQLTF